MTTKSIMEVRSKELSELVFESDEETAASLLVEHASNEDSSLHECFEWDDTIAAHEHRLSQARHILRTYPIYDVTEKELTGKTVYVELVNVPSKDNKGEGVYMTINKLSQDDEALHRALDQLTIQLKGLMRTINLLSGLIRNRAA